MAKLHPLKFVKMLFGGDDSREGLATALPATPNDDENAEPPGNGGRGMENHKFSKLSILRDSLKFDDEIADKVNDIFTPRNMLLFIYDNILFKFEILRTLGVLNDTTYKNINLIQSKCQLLLTPGSTESTPSTIEDLEQENDSLKRQLESLYSKHVKSDIVSGEELRLEEELRRIRSRYEELAKRYDFSRKKVESLAKEVSRLEKISTRFELLKQKFNRYEKNDSVMQETVLINRDLETKNKALRAKLDHQERLLNAVVWSGSQDNEIVQSVARLNSKKEELTRQMQDKDNNLLNIFNSNDNEIKLSDEANNLIGENKNLYIELSNEDNTENLTEHSDGNAAILFNIESLHDENLNIEKIIDAQSNVISNAKSYVDGQGEMKLISSLQDENHLLRQALETKKSKIKNLVNNPEHDRLLAANSELNRTVIRMQHEIDNLSHTINVLNTRCRDAESKLDGARQIARANLYLKKESEKFRVVANKFNALHMAYNEKNKALVGMTLKLNNALETCKRLQLQNSMLEAKVNNLHAQYSGLMDEYNKLFYNER